MGNFRVRGLTNPGTDALYQGWVANLHALDEQWLCILRIIESPYADEGVPPGVTKKRGDESLYGRSVGIAAHDATPSSLGSFAIKRSGPARPITTSAIPSPRRRCDSSRVCHVTGLIETTRNCV